MHSPVTIHSSDGTTRATILPTLGFTCIEFVSSRAGPEVSVLDAEPEILSGQCRPGRSGIPLLFPFPNRIRNGEFMTHGQTYCVTPPSWFPQTIHGFCVDHPWRVVESGSSHVTGEFLLSRDAPERRRQWPADARLLVQYSVHTGRLRADITVENPDSIPLPWGFGTHPYFRLPLGNNSTPRGCVIRAAANEQWELEQCYPTGQRHAVPEQKDLRSGWQYGTCPLDDVYTALTPSQGVQEQVIEDPVARIQLTQRCGADFRELVVFTPQDRSVICLEPYTCVTDAMNLQARGIDAGWRELDPGERHFLWFELEVSALGGEFPLA